MGRKQREIDALKLQLEEVIRANEDLRLENAEFRAKFDMLQKTSIEEKDESVTAEESNTAELIAEESDLEPEVIDEPTDAPSPVSTFTSEPQKEKIEVVDFTPENSFLEEDDEPNYFYRAQRNEIDSHPFVKETEKKEEVKPAFNVETEEKITKNVASNAAEIEELKSQNKILFEELKAIRELLSKRDAEKKSENPADDVKSSGGYNDIPSNMGKLIVDSQIGAAKIIDDAKKEAERELAKARREADKMKAKIDENNYAVYRKLGAARRDIDEIISQMESVSDHINSAKDMVDTDDFEF